MLVYFTNWVCMRVYVRLFVTMSVRVCVCVFPNRGGTPGCPRLRAGPEACSGGPPAGWGWLCGRSRGRRAGQRVGLAPQHHLVDTHRNNMLRTIQSGDALINLNTIKIIFRQKKICVCVLWSYQVRPQGRGWVCPLLSDWLWARCYFDGLRPPGSAERCFSSSL